MAAQRWRFVCEYVRFESCVGSSDGTEQLHGCYTEILLHEQKNIKLRYYVGKNQYERGKKYISEIEFL